MAAVRRRAGREVLHAHSRRAQAARRGEGDVGPADRSRAADLRGWSLVMRLGNLLPWRKRRLEQDLERELAHHLERRVEDLRRSGVTEDEARRIAGLEFGSVTRVR